jgi:hypothetical protein
MPEASTPDWLTREDLATLLEKRGYRPNSSGPLSPGALVSLLSPGKDTATALAGALVATLWLQDARLPAVPETPARPADIGENEWPAIRDQIESIREGMEKRLAAEFQVDGKIYPGISVAIPDLATRAGRWFHSLLDGTATWAVGMTAQVDALGKGIRKAHDAATEPGKTADARTRAVLIALNLILTVLDEMETDSAAFASKLSTLATEMAAVRNNLMAGENQYAPFLSGAVADIRKLIADHPELGLKSPADAIAPEEAIRALVDQLSERLGVVRKKIDDETATLAGFGGAGGVLTWLTGGTFAPVYIAVMAGVGGDRINMWRTEASLEMQKMVLSYELQVGAMIAGLPKCLRQYEDAVNAALQGTGAVAKQVAALRGQVESMKLDVKSGARTIDDLGGDVFADPDIEGPLQAMCDLMQRSLKPLTTPALILTGASGHEGSAA